MSLTHGMHEKRTIHAEEVPAAIPRERLEKQGDQEKTRSHGESAEQKQSKNLSVVAFEKEMDLFFEKLELHRSFQDVEWFLQELETPVSHGKPNQETVEFYCERCESVRTRFSKNEEESFLAWVKGQLTEEESALARQALYWEKQQRISDRLKRAGAGLEKIFSVMSKGQVNGSVLARLEKVLVHMRGIESALSVDVEKIFESYLLEMTRRRAAHPGMLAKLFGTSEQKEFGKVIDHLNTEWLMQREPKSHMNNKDRLQAKTEQLFSSGSIKEAPAAAKDRNRINKDLKKQGSVLRQLIEESPGFAERPAETDIENLEEYRKTAGFTEAFADTFTVLKPVLGRKEFVERIICHESLGQNVNAAGNFDLVDRVLRLNWRPGVKEYECIRTIAHETGHAMQLENSLSLKDAIRFAFEMLFCMGQEGHVSQYSKDAATMYAEKIVHSIGEKLLTSQKNIERAADIASDAAKQEEWAEMVAYSIIPSSMSVVAPIKSVLVRKYALKFGLDINLAQVEIQQRLPTVAFDPSDRASVAAAEASIVGSSSI